MPSNEAIDLLENVLSNISESERWQYRDADIANKKIAELNKQIDDEEKKIEYYDKDPSKQKELIRKLRKVHNFSNDWVNAYRKGIDAYTGEKLNPKENDHDKDEIKDRRIWFKTNIDDKTLFNGATHERHPLNNNLTDKEKALHDRINKRTKAFDTTAKHEACMILIEALNTLLNE